MGRAFTTPTPNAEAVLKSFQNEPLTFNLVSYHNSVNIRPAASNQTTQVVEIPAVDDDWSGRWWIGRRRLDDECQTWQRVHWNSVVRPVRVVILVDNSFTHTLLASHQAAVPLSTAHDTRVIALQMVLPQNEGHSRPAEMVPLRMMDLSSYQCYRSLGPVWFMRYHSIFV